MAYDILEFDELEFDELNFDEGLFDESIPTPPPPGEPLKFEQETRVTAPPSRPEIEPVPEDIPERTPELFTKDLFGPETPVKPSPLSEKDFLIKLSQDIPKEMTPKQYAEEQILGAPEEGALDILAEKVYKAREFIPLKWLGMSLAEGKLLTQEERKGLEYLTALSHAEERLQERRAEQVARKKELETAFEMPTAEPATTGVQEEIPTIMKLRGESEARITELSEPEKEKVNTAVGLFTNLINIAKATPEFGRRFTGMLLAEADELAVGFGALGGVKKIASLSKMGKELKQIDELRKNIQAMNGAQRQAFREILRSTRDIRATRQALNLAGETAAFTLPTVMEGEIPTGEELATTAGVIGGLKVGAKAISKLKKGKLSPKELGPTAKQLIEETDITAAEAMKLEPINKIVGKIKERRKTTPKRREQSEGMFFQENQNRVLAERLQYEFETTGQELTKNNFKTFWNDLTGEKISREEAGELIKNIYGQKLETLKKGKPDVTTPAKTEPAKPSSEIPTKAKAEEIPAPKASVEKEVPEDIIKPLDVIEKEIAEAEGPKHIKTLKEKRELMEDGVIPRVLQSGVFKNSIKKMDDAGIRYSYVRVDGRNMKGGNNELGHAGMDDAMRKVWGDVFRSEVEKEGGLLARLTKGDEMGVVFPNKSVEQTKKIMAQISQKIDAKIKELGLHKFQHYRNRLPETGTLGIDYGVAKGRPGKFAEMDADAAKISDAAKEIFEDNLAKKHGMIYFKEGGYYVKRSALKETGTTPEQLPTRGTGTSVEGQKPRGEGRGKETPSKEPKVISFEDFKKTHSVRKKAGEKADKYKARVEADSERAYKEYLDSQPTQLSKSGKETVSGNVQRRQTGAVGPQEQLKVTGESDALSAQRKLAKGRKDVREKQKPKISKLWNWFSRQIVQQEAPIAKGLMNDPQGRKALMYFQNSRGASGASDIISKQTKKKIKAYVPHGQETMFEDLLQHFRTIEVDKLMKGKWKQRLTKEDLEMIPEGMTPANFRVQLIKSPTTVKESQAYIDQVKKEFPEVYAQLEKGMNEYWSAMKKNVEDLHKEGLISDGLRDYLIANHKHYSPRFFVQHLDPMRTTVDAGGRRVHVPDSGIKKLDKGSEDALVTDWEFLLDQSILRTQTRIFKNRANKELLKYVEQTPDNPFGFKVESFKTNKKGEPVFDAVPPGKTRVTAMVKGEPRSILMDDEYAKIWATSDPLLAQEGAQFLKLATGTPVLKWMATGANPEFAITNMARDMVYTWFKQHEAFSPILPIGIGQLTKEMVKAFPDVAARKGAYLKYMLNGGSMDFMTSQGFIFKPKIGELKGPMSDALSGMNNILGYAGNTSEALTRIALMNRLLKQGKSLDEAVWIARTNLDFAQGGRITKFLDNGIPYLGAGVQGTRGIFQGFKTNPKLATFKASQVMALSFGLSYWGMKKFGDWYENISPREKESGWIVPLPYEFEDKQGIMRYPYLKIPKDYGQRVFGSIGHALAEQTLGKEPDWEGMRMSITDLLPIDATGWLPPTAGAMLSYALNKDFWRRKDIWKGRKVSPQFEFYADTPQFWVLLGDKTGLSPERLRGAASEILPHNIYTDMMGVAWKELVGDKNEINKMMYEKLEDVPFARKVLRLTWPDRGDDLQMMKDMISLKKKGVEIDLDRKDGSEKPKKLVKTEIKQAQTKVEDYKHLNDIELHRLMIEEFSGPIPENNPKITEFIQKAAKEHPFEGSRLSQRYRKFKKKAIIRRKGNKTWEIFKEIKQEP